METLFDIDSLKEEVNNLTKGTFKEGFWDDQKKAQDIISKINEKKDKLSLYKEVRDGLSNVLDMLEILDEESFIEYKEELEKLVKEYDKKLESLTIRSLLNGEYDKNNCIMSIHAGQGGLEATDWAEMLYRMYTRWLENSGFKYSINEYNSEEGGGIKSVSLDVNGAYAYGMLKSERGVHRLVRISPFDSNKRRHTSFASVDVYPQLNDDQEVEINEKDLKIDTYRSTGAGGQHVNTTDSAVRITHLPTGVVVTCQNERSQIQNRAKAMDMLKAKLVQIKEEEHKEKIEDIQGSYSQIAWGSQIRSYVFQPYTMVKDHRTKYETGNIDAVMDGDLDSFIYSYLMNEKEKNN